MSISAGFLWRFLDDVWDLLPSQDRALFETYWSGFIQIGGNLQQKIIEATLSATISDVPVFLTERWNRFVMDQSSCDLFDKTETLTLNGFLPTNLGVETAFYDTFALGDPSGAVVFSEQIEFFDNSIRKLRYGSLLPNFISVQISSIEYTEGRDYVVNDVDGTIQALEGGRLPIDQVATVTYGHSQYTRGLDYQIDEPKSRIFRLPGSAIPDGDQVVATYTYNTTPTIPLQGTSGAVLSDLTTFQDMTQDFSGLLPGRKLTILSGPNAGVYSIGGASDANNLTISPPFSVPQPDGGVAYSINAFPHGQRVAQNIASIPVLQDLIDNPTLVLREGVDYAVLNGILATRAAFPLMTIGPVPLRVNAMWAEKTFINAETPYRNFGVLIDFYRQNSEAYKQALQGLWYTFWTGSTPANLQTGLHILLGLPYARSAGTVIALVLPTMTMAGSAQIQDSRGQILSYVLPSELAATVQLGDTVNRFQPLTTGVKIIDRNSEPGFVMNRLGRAGINRFLTSKASRGPGDTDETKALTLLENHLFVPQVLSESLTTKVNVQELVTFLDNMKPKWTTFVFSFNEDAEESFGFDSGNEQINTSTAIDLTTTVGNNEENHAWDRNSFIVDRATGETIPGGDPQFLGNFRDHAADFVALGIGPGDYIRIGSGTYQGYHRILTRINSTDLGIDIDQPIVFETNLPYIILQKEFLIGHDAIGLKREHVILNGTTYSAPMTLSIATDIDLFDTKLTPLDVEALLLIDINNVGHEVQAITAALIFDSSGLAEVTVANPPAPGASSHQIASASLTRRDNTLGSITHAFAI